MITPNPFSQLILNSSPNWNVCPTTSTSDYSAVVQSEAIFGSYDPATGTGTQSTSTPNGAVPLTFGFKIFLTNPGATSNPPTPSGLKIYKGLVTQMKVTRGDAMGTFTGFSTVPTKTGSGVTATYTMGAAATDFATIAVTFTPKIGADSSTGMLFTGDASGPGVVFNVAFTGMVSLFASGALPTRRNLMFRRDVSMYANGTVADGANVIHYYGTQNETAIVITVPSLDNAVNKMSIAGAVVGGVLGMVFIGGISYYFFSNKRRMLRNDISSPMAQSSGKLESGMY